MSPRHPDQDAHPPVSSLRAHHFLCIATYRGKGYSADFVANMNRLWAAARAGAIGDVRATAAADPICHCCPHLADRADPRSCRFQDSIGLRDRRMLEAFGWEEDQEVSFQAVMDVVHERHGGLMDRVCGGCDWVPVCSRQHFTLRDPSFTLEGERQGPARERD